MVIRSEAPNLAVDELRRRARRRLIGAIVLALAAAVLLPLLLESEPKPLGDEVSIQIPPIDNSKFVNPLSPGKGAATQGGNAAPADASSTPQSSNAPAPTVGKAPVEPPREGGAPAALSSAPPAASPGSEEKSGETRSAAATPPPTVAAPATMSSVPAPNSAEEKKEAPADAKPAAKLNDAVPAGGFVVQVAAFTDRYGAQAQARKLKRAGFPAYVEPVATDKSELQRVRVGPYASRDAADAAKAKLKAAGYDAIVARAR